MQRTTPLKEIADVCSPLSCGAIHCSLEDTFWRWLWLSHPRYEQYTLCCRFFLEAAMVESSKIIMSSILCVVACCLHWYVRFLNLEQTRIKEVTMTIKLHHKRSDALGSGNFKLGGCGSNTEVLHVSWDDHTFGGMSSCLHTRRLSTGINWIQFARSWLAPSLKSIHACLEIRHSLDFGELL